MVRKRINRKARSVKRGSRYSGYRRWGCLLRIVIEVLKLLKYGVEIVRIILELIRS